ncbi:PREDICTED: uncharacterized protein LOC109227975 [Nicotiana attenuata]|uniref:uncharacterized protein LOC109227975 n=1 Tax=Nicotiana attenuata TaxID=49451 RepID=UPI000905846B|nr:PREDICTED: uncharacterized protein LOC109227975 [Nicotiana attenuata]
MLKFVYGVWNFISTPHVFLHNNGYFIFKFENEEDKAAILQQGPYTFNYRPFILKQWDPEFQIHKESTQIVLMWVMFPNMPIQFWALGNLGRIASCLGNPICTDKLTSQEQRVAYDRILIEMDISQPLPDSLSLELPDGKYYSQSIEYEWKPMYCQDCLKVGHITGNCKERPAEYKQPQQNIKKKQKKLDWKAKTMPNQTGDNQNNVLPTEQGTRKEQPKNEQATKGDGQQQRKQIDRGKRIMPVTTDKNQEIDELELMLRRNQFSALRIHPEVTTSNVVRDTNPTKQPP